MYTSKKLLIAFFNQKDCVGLCRQTYFLSIIQKNHTFFTEINFSKLLKFGPPIFFKSIREHLD